MDKISVNIATYPGRERIFKITAKQFIKFEFPPDQINVFLNDYKEVPDWLKQYPYNFKLGVGGAENKFFFVDNFDGYYFTCDDDLVYPKNYIQKMVDGIEKYNRTSIISIHGAIYTKFPLTEYSRNERCFVFSRGLDKDKRVHMMSSSTLAFHTSTMKDKGFTRSCLPAKNMADPYLAKWCMEHDIPVRILARPNAYVVELPTSQAGPCIANDAQVDKGGIRAGVINSIKNFKLNIDESNG